MPRTMPSPVASQTPSPSLTPTALVDALQELLAAERAGARVAMSSLGETQDAGQRHLLEQIRLGEADSCRRLSASLQQLGAAPTGQVSDFHDRAMAIADLAERLAFVDRGQRWVIRRIQALLPGCGNAVVRPELQAVLQTHEVNSLAYGNKTEQP